MYTYTTQNFGLVVGITSNTQTIQYCFFFLTFATAHSLLLSLVFHSGKPYRWNNIIVETVQTPPMAKTVAPDAIPLFEPEQHEVPPGKRQMQFAVQNRCWTNTDPVALEKGIEQQEPKGFHG